MMSDPFFSSERKALLSSTNQTTVPIFTYVYTKPSVLAYSNEKPGVPTETLCVYLEPQDVQLASSPVWLCIEFLSLTVSVILSYFFLNPYLYAVALLKADIPLYKNMLCTQDPC